MPADWDGVLALACRTFAELKTISLNTMKVFEPIPTCTPRDWRNEVQSTMAKDGDNGEARSGFGCIPNRFPCMSVRRVVHENNDAGVRPGIASRLGLKSRRHPYSFKKRGTSNHPRCLNTLPDFLEQKD